MSEPIVLLVRLGAWLFFGVAGFTLLIWGTGHHRIVNALIDAGSSVFTLGFATDPGAVPAIIAFSAAAFGLIVVALQIAYLPALYDSFNRRETQVTILESRAGIPAWGPELIARHYLVGLQSNLGTLYADWERWAADVAESHTTYPSLMWMRSPHPDNSWIVALVAVLDSAALNLALLPDSAPPEARLCIRMGFTCLRDIARSQGLDYDQDPFPSDPIALTYPEFSEAVERLERANVPIERAPVEAWPHFRGWRINYESIAYQLVSLVSAPPAPWTGPRKVLASVSEPDRPVDRKPAEPTSERLGFQLPDQ